MNAFRTVMPLVQRLLPLLEGNVLTAISNVLTPRPHRAAASTEGRSHAFPGRAGRAPDAASRLARPSDGAERVGSSAWRISWRWFAKPTDRNTLEQQELLEDLKIFSGKVKVIAVIGIGVLMIGLVLNLLLFLHIQRVLP